MKRACSQPAKTRDRVAGFTLFEVLVVLALIGLVIGAVSRGIRALAKTDLRQGATKVAGAMRYLFDRASTTGKVHRLVLDFDGGKVWAEVSDDRYLMAHERETDETRRKEAEAIAKETEESAVEQEAEESMSEGSAGSASRGGRVNASAYQPKEFRPKRAKFEGFKEMALKPIKLPAKVKLASLFTPRLAAPISEGKGYIYFFPLGQAEAAMVHLSDPKSESFYTLTVHPLTGRVQIFSEYIEPPVEEQFDDEGARIER